MQTKSKKLEQIDEIIGTNPKVQVKKKRKTKLLIITTGLLITCCVVVLGATALAWYGGYVQEGLCNTAKPDSGLWNDLKCDNSPTPTIVEAEKPTITPTKEIINTITPEVTKEVDQNTEIIDIELDDKTVQIKMSKLPYTGSFKKDFEGQNIIQMYNNQAKTGSTGQYLTYFGNEKAMTNYYAHNDRKLPFESISYPLETETLSNGTTINYLNKYLAADDDFQGGGLFYSWTPTTPVHGYKASTITNYINVDPIPNNNYNPDTSMFIDAICVFKLYDISKNEYGYLGFDGYASAGSEINYCEMLNDLDVFEISIIDN